VYTVEFVNRPIFVTPNYGYTQTIISRERVKIGEMEGKGKKGKGAKSLRVLRTTCGKMRNKRPVRDCLTETITDSKLSGIAVVQLQDVADVISGEHVTLLPGDGDDVVVHVT